MRGIEMCDAGGKLKEHAVAMEVIRPTSQLLVVWDKGVGKRTR